MHRKTTWQLGLLSGAPPENRLTHRVATFFCLPRCNKEQASVQRKKRVQCDSAARPLGWELTV